MINIEFYKTKSKYYISVDSEILGFMDFIKNHKLGKTVYDALNTYFREQSGFINVTLEDALESFKDNNNVPDIKLVSKYKNGELIFIPVEYDNDEFNANFAALLLAGKNKSNNDKK